MTNIIIPSSPEDRKKIQECMVEISNSMSRSEGEKCFIKEAIAALEDEVGIPKKILRKMATAYHKQNITEMVTDIEDVEALLEATKL
jgi:glutaminase